MFTITCESYPRERPSARARNNCVNACHTTYASGVGVAMLEIRVGDTTSDMWRSEDNGRTWELADQVPFSQPRPGGYNPERGQVLKIEFSLIALSMNAREH